MPSSAMSLPSLAFPGESHEADDIIGEANVRPQLEKSSTSASIIRNKRDKAKFLDKVVEKAGGSSNESLENSDPAVKLKKKKDQINQTKKKEAMKKATSPIDDGEKSKVVKVSSLPEPITVEVMVHEANESSEGDTENEEITIRKKAIAEAEIEVHNLQQEIKETEQAELTDTDCDNDNTDTDTNDTGSETGTVSDVGSSKYESLLENLSWAVQMELEEQLTGYETRLPGRAIQLHDKLSSPARSRDTACHTLRHCQEKQDKARMRRMRFAKEKSSKLSSLLQRKQRKQELIDKVGEVGS